MDQFHSGGWSKPLAFGQSEASRCPRGDQRIPIDALALTLKDCEQSRRRLQGELAALDGLHRLNTFDVTRIERDLRGRVKEWRRLLKRQTPIARQVVSRLLDDRIVWTPRKDEGLYEFTGRATFDRLLSGIVVTEGDRPQADLDGFGQLNGLGFERHDAAVPRHSRVQEPAGRWGSHRPARAREDEWKRT